MDDLIGLGIVTRPRESTFVLSSSISCVWRALLHCSLMVSKWFHSMVSTLPNPSRDASPKSSLLGCVAQSPVFLGQTSHHQNFSNQITTRRIGTYAPCGISGDALTSSLRCTKFLLVSVNAISLRATAIWRGICKDIVVFFLPTSRFLLARIAARETVSRPAPGS